MSSHPNRFEISLCQPRPPLPRGDPSSTRPIKGVCARVCGLLGRGQTRGRAFREGGGLYVGQCTDDVKCTKV